MLRARELVLLDGTTLKGVMLMEADESFYVFIEDDDGTEILRDVPRHNVKWIDYDDKKAIELLRNLALMQLTDAMEDIEEFVDEYGSTEAFELPSDGEKATVVPVSKDPYQ